VIFCFQVQKKRRIIARVQCRNIKNECPKLTCDEPVLLPGRCCKSCPGDFSKLRNNTYPYYFSPRRDYSRLISFFRSSRARKRWDKPR